MPVYVWVQQCNAIKTSGRGKWRVIAIVDSQCYCVKLIGVMPGKNCAFVECHVYRKKESYSIFIVPKGEDEWSKNWRKQLIDIITKYRVVDAKSRCQIENKMLVFVSDISQKI